MDSVYNNTFVPLNAGDIWEGQSESVGKFDVAMVSCITDTSGVLHLSFSQDNNNFDFVKTYIIKAGEPFIINQKVEAKWFFAEFINDSGVDQTYLRLTTVYKNDIRSDLDIRPLHSEKDTITIPALNECITEGRINVNVEGVTVSGVVVDISGQTVDIKGQTVKSQVYDYNNYAITSQLIGSKRGLDVNNIGTLKAYEGTAIKEVGAFTDSHNNINLQVYDDALNDKINNTDTIGEDTGAIKVYVSNSTNHKVNCDISGQRVDISGQTIAIKGGVDISGQRVDISGERVDISGQRVDISGSRVDISGQRVDISGQSISVSNEGFVIKAKTSGGTVNLLADENSYLYVNIKGQSVDISGQRVDISGQRVDISGQTIAIKGGVDISGQRVDISGERVDISGQRVDISGSRVDISGQKVDISGQRIDISGSRVDISGQRVDISGQRVDISGSRVDISGQRVDISGSRVDISGQRVDISGQRVDISGQTVDISGQSIRIVSMPTFTVTADISGQRVDISGETIVVKDLSGHRVDISGQRIDISGQSLRMMGFDGVSAYNNLYVDANGFISANVLSTAHENIYLGFDTYYADYCSGSSNVGIWSKNNPNALSVDGWYCSSPASTNEISIFTYLNHFFGAYNQSNFTFADIDTWYCVMQNWNCVNSNTMPIIRVHSATSRWDYTIDAGQTLNNGEAIMPYFGLLSRIKNNDTEVRRVPYSLTGGTGVRGSGENITKIEMYIPATVAEFIEMNVIEGAVYVKNKGLINYYYTNDKVGREQNDIHEIKLQSDKLTFTPLNRLLCDVCGNVAVKNITLDQDTYHFTNPASFGDPAIVKASDGTLASSMYGSNSFYDNVNNKVIAGNMRPITTEKIDAPNPNYYWVGLHTYDISMNSKIAGAMNNKGKFDISGQRVDVSGQRVDVSGQRVDVSGQGMLLNAYSRTDATNKVVSSVQPYGAGTSTNSVRALETYAYNVGLNNHNGLNLPITSTTATAIVGDTVQAMDTYLYNPQTAVNTSIFGITPVDYRNGLNVYQIYPKKKTFTWSGRTADNITGNTYTVIGGVNGNIAGANMTSVSYSYGKVPKVHYASCTALGYTLVYSYVDSNYNLVENEEKVLTTTGTTLAGGVAIFCVLKFALKEGNQSANVNIFYDLNNNLSYRIGYLTNVVYYNGLMTIPNGWVGKISNLYFQCSASQNWNIIKYNRNNLNQEMIARGIGFSNTVVASSPEGYGGLLLSGETVLMIRETIATNTEFIATITMEQVSNY